MDQSQEQICQSCGMPLQKATDFGTNADESQNEEYCIHCFQKGQFTQPDITEQEMTEQAAGFMVRDMNMPEEEAKQTVAGYIPNLKRWQTTV